jgi:hypothetical protein
MLKIWRTSGAGVKNEWSYTCRPPPPIYLEGTGETNFTLKSGAYELSLSLWLMKDDTATTEVHSARWLAVSRKAEVEVSERELGIFFLHC